MSLVKVKDVLRLATEKKFGVPAINVFNYETVLWAIKAAEAEKMPIIIQLYPGFAGHIPLKYVAFFAKDMAEKANVPVSVHLDHSNTAAIALEGIRDGFPSVMVDGSAQSFEDNVAMTLKVVEVARVWGVDVEAELGHVGSGANEDDIINADHYTKVEDAVRFVELTGVDSLAIAVGNAHGPYVRVPKLDFDRISAIRAAISIPLVLHGSSDIPDDQMQRVVNLGMSKFNIATEYDRAYFKALRDGFAGDSFKRASAFGILRSIESKMMAFIGSKIQLLNPNHFSL